MGPSRKRKAAPTEIPGDSFGNQADLSLDVLRSLVVSSPADTANLISDWSRGIGCGLVCTLSNDNRRVLSCKPVLLGDLLPLSNSNARKSFAVNGCWPGFPALAIAFSPIDAATFSFNESCVSDWVDSSAVEYDFLSNNQVLSDQDCEEANIRGFALRIFLVPTTHEYVKLTLTLCPLPLTELTTDHPLYASPKFPQLKIWSGMVPFLPTSRSFIATDWGCSFLPAIIPGSPLSDTYPSGTTLRAALSATLRSATRPEIKANSSTLFPRWTAIQEQGAAALDTAAPDLIWPDTEVSTLESTGRNDFILMAIFSPCYLSCNFYYSSILKAKRTHANTFILFSCLNMFILGYNLFKMNLFL